MRSVLGLMLVSSLLAPASAEERGRVYRVAVLSPGSIEGIIRVTLPELAKLGFIEGTNLSLTTRSGVPIPEFPAVARELVEKEPDLLVGVSSSAVKAFAAVTDRIPILMSFVGDPVEEGVIASISRPPGNITGQALYSAEQSGKRVELLREAVPTARRVAVLSSGTPGNEVQVREMVGRGERLGLTMSVVRAPEPEGYQQAFSAITDARADAVVIASYPSFARDAETLAALALAARLPTVCEWDYMARRGCLISFGPDNDDLRRRSAHLVAKLLRGTPPAELPVEGPDRFELVLNIRTARALGIEFPPTFLARADEVIE